MRIRQARAEATPDQVRAHLHVVMLGFGIRAAASHIEARR